MKNQRLDALLTAYFTGSLDAANLEQLNHILCEDESARMRFAELAGHEVDLHDVVAERLASQQADTRLRLWPSLAAAASLVAVLGWWAWQGTPLATQAAVQQSFSVETAVGPVQAWTADASRPIELGPGDTVRPGTRIETTRGQTLELVHTDKRLRATLAAESTLIWPEQAADSERLLRLERGRLSADLTSHASKPSLRVRTPHADVRVTGTRLDIRAGENETRVDVETGRVQVKTVAATAWSPVAAGQTAILSGTEEKGALTLLGEILFEDTFDQGLDHWDLEVLLQDNIVMRIPPDHPLRQTVRTVETKHDGARIACLEIDGMAAQGQDLNLASRQRFPLQDWVIEVAYKGLAYGPDHDLRIGGGVNAPAEIEPVTETVLHKPAIMQKNQWHVRRGEYRVSVNERGGLDLLSKNYHDGQYIFEQRTSYESAEDRAIHLTIHVRNIRMRFAHIVLRRLITE